MTNTDQAPSGSERITLRHIAAEAGVSVGAASYALNGRPGVSDATRQRILQVAGKLGWAPNPAARALSASRANAIGYAMVRPPGVRSVDTYFVQLMSGLEEEASAQRLGLVLRLAATPEELVRIYREWWAARSIDGVVMTDLIADDPRLSAIQELGIPAVAIGGANDMARISTVAGDTEETTQRIIHYLWALGHRRISRVAGPRDLLHTRTRDRAFAQVLATLPGGRDAHRTLYTNYSSGDGNAATRDLLISPDRPTAIIYDNDVMAVSALLIAEELHVGVPDDLSIVTWDDSDLCTIVRPAISAVVQEPILQARTAVKLLAAELRGDGPHHVLLPAREFAVRGSSAIAPAASNA